MQIAFLILLFLVGACFGSFLCCQARRLRLRARHSRSLGPRSVCPHCKYQLKWYDNLPIISWLALKGKCRKCHAKIGLAEILSELGLALAFLALGTTIDIKTATLIPWLIFASTLILVIILSFLAIYDGLYGELPTLYLTISIICAIITLSLRTWGYLSSSQFSPNLVTGPLLAVMILGGLYLILYLISHGKWVGDGDWLLASAIAITLGSPWLALITLFLANLIALIFSLPGRSKNPKIHLGPFLVTAFIITLTFANFFQSMIQ